MENLDAKLKICLISPNEKNLQFIATCFNSQRGIVERVEIIESKEEFFEKVKEGKINALVINIFSYGIPKGIKIIEEIREMAKEEAKKEKGKKEKEIPVCILGTSEDFECFKKVPVEWISNFRKYCRVAIDVPPSNLDKDIKRMSLSMFRYRKEKILLNQQNIIKNDPNLSEEEKVQQITELFAEAIELASEQGKGVNEELGLNKPLIPGISAAALPVVMRKTLEQTTNSINVYKWTNVGIIAAGLFFIFASLVIFWKDPGKNPEILGFGGLGLAGIIASLITAPSGSIGKAARQLIQIQISYFSYLKHIEILEDAENKNNTDNAMVRSARLKEITDSLHESLHKYFDSDKVYKAQIELQKEILKHSQADKKNKKPQENENETTTDL
jgi:molybdenum-dependent DNA-binding transcriptional regulator ModE